MLDKNFREEKMVAGYAAQLYVTANYLKQDCQENHRVLCRTSYQAARSIGGKTHGSLF